METHKLLDCVLIIKAELYWWLTPTVGFPRQTLGAIFSSSIQPSRKVSLGLDCLAFTCHLYWWSHTEESLVYRWNHIEISVVYRWSHTKVSLVYRWNHTEASLVYRWNHTEASLVCRWNHTEAYPYLASYVPGSVCKVHVQLPCCTACRLPVLIAV